MDQVTLVNSSQTEQPAETAASLARKSARLRQLIGSFNLGDSEAARKRSPAEALAPQRGAARPLRPGKAASSVAAVAAKSPRHATLDATLDLTLAATQGCQDHFEEF